MVRKEPENRPPPKKLSMKTRLGLILVIFILVNIVFFLVFDSDESESETELGQSEQDVTEEKKEEKLYPKFNPPE